MPPTTGTTSGGKHAKPYSPTDDELAAQDQATRTEVYGVTGGSGTTGSTGATTPTTSPGSGDTTTKTDSSDSTKSDEYTVGSGDSLSSIAAAQHIDGGWNHLYALNENLIGSDPNLIKPGQILNLG
jgi:Tfp pilus assembly protein FimV